MLPLCYAAPMIGKKLANKKNDFGPPEVCPDLAAAVGVAAILAGQREVPQVVESNPAVVGRHQNLVKKME